MGVQFRCDGARWAFSRMRRTPGILNKLKRRLTKDAQGPQQGNILTCVKGHEDKFVSVVARETPSAHKLPLHVEVIDLRRASSHLFHCGRELISSYEEKNK